MPGLGHNNKNSQVSRLSIYKGAHVTVYKQRERDDEQLHTNDNSEHNIHKKVRNNTIS